MKWICYMKYAANNICTGCNILTVAHAGEHVDEVEVSHTPESTTSCCYIRI